LYVLCQHQVRLPNKQDDTMAQYEENQVPELEFASRKNHAERGGKI